MAINSESACPSAPPSSLALSLSLSLSQRGRENQRSPPRLGRLRLLDTQLATSVNRYVLMPPLPHTHPEPPATRSARRRGRGEVGRGRCGLSIGDAVGARRIGG